MVVRMRHTRAHTANRRSHHALKGAGLTKCVKCGAMTKMHMVCPACGYYKGSEKVNTMAKIQKKNKKKEAKKSK
jgi:large subunit ribosomal protein L32